MLNEGNTIVHIAQYAAPYQGNFIRSLVALEEYLHASREIRTVYVFPQRCQQQPWFGPFGQQHQVQLIQDDTPQTADAIYAILRQVRPTIAHCHFDGYDTATAKACERYNGRDGGRVRLIWHLHNAKGFSQRGLSRVKWGMKFALHYGYYGRDASIISVSDQMHAFADRYRRMVRGRRFALNETIPNGVELTRCGARGDYAPHEPFTFLAYGGIHQAKRIDLLAKAGLLLAAEGGAPFRVLITRGADTERVVSGLLGERLPDWCQLVEQQEDITRLFDQADCFVSTSAFETFSYGICEASIYGLPVIQSDIAGTMWNARNPSTFLFESMHEEDLMRAMREVMLADTDDLRAACIQTRQRNAATYGISHWCQSIMDYYDRLTSKRE